MDTVRLFVISHHKDFWKEREMIQRNFLPDLRTWCESKNIQLLETDVRWGGIMSMENAGKIKQQIQTSYHNGELPFFLHLTTESFGTVPLHGDAPENVLDDIHKKLGITSVEIEILHGAYSSDNPNNIFMVRSDDFLRALHIEDRKSFINISLSEQQSETCKNCLKKFSVDKIFQYSYVGVHIHRETRKPEIVIDRTMFQKILVHVQKLIEHQQPGLPQAPSFCIQSRDKHQAFMLALTGKVRGQESKVKGRETVIQQLEDYIQTGGNDVPLLLLGGAGSGKSSIMAHAAYKFSQPGYLEQYFPGDTGSCCLVFYMFVGAVPGSSELLPMLQRLLKELDLITDSSMPHNVEAAAQMCCSALSSGTQRPLLLIIDAINQFEEEPATQIMSWVPRKLAPNVRCILSMINDSVQHKRLMSRESKPQELHVIPLHFEARRQIVMEKLSVYGQSLLRDQMNCLLAKKGSENPLWLSIATEELRTVKDPSEFDHCVREMPEGLHDLLESALCRLEHEHGSLLVACLCLLEVSITGLLETELCSLLGALPMSMSPSPYEEKEETESSEKDLGKRRQGEQPLAHTKWLQIYNALRLYLRPFGDNRDGRLHFYHIAFSKAVKTKYFKIGRENESSEESQDIYRHWHQQLADYFEHCSDTDRKAEEYLHHLVQIEDTYRLCQGLCDWSILDKLYHDEYSAKLLAFWRKAGGTDNMIRCHKEALRDLEALQPRDNQLIAVRNEQVARIYLQAGEYAESLELAQIVIKWEEKELGNRADRMVELNSLMAEIYEEKLKLNDFVSPTQLPDLKKTIMFARKSIDLRKTFNTEYHKLKLGLSLMKLAFSLESWNACGGDESVMTGTQAICEGNKHIDEALTIFQELKDAGHYAEALMTKGVLAPRGSMEQLKYYNEAMEICRQVYGEESLLSSRLYINIGIVHEDNNDFVKAYEYFKKWADTSEIVLGPDHPKTIRAKGVLREPRYRLVALRIKQQHETNSNEANTGVINEEEINHEVEDLDESDEGNPNHLEESDQDEEENLSRRESTEPHSNIQQLIHSSDLVQRLFNDIWQRMGDNDAPPTNPMTPRSLIQTALVNLDAPVPYVVAECAAAPAHASQPQTLRHEGVARVPATSDLSSDDNHFQWERDNPLDPEDNRFGEMLSTLTLAEGNSAQSNRDDSALDLCFSLLQQAPEATEPVNLGRWAVQQSQSSSNEENSVSGSTSIESNNQHVPRRFDSRDNDINAEIEAFLTEISSQLIPDNDQAYLDDVNIDLEDDTDHTNDGDDDNNDDIDHLTTSVAVTEHLPRLSSVTSLRFMNLRSVIDNEDNRFHDSNDDSSL